MKTTTATLRTFRVARLINNGLRHTAIVRAEAPAAAVREALGLDRAPAWTTRARTARATA